MSERGSAKSADTKFRINAHDYFVPAIVLVVLCILIVATFDDNEAVNLADGFAGNTQADNPAASETAVTMTHLNTADAADTSNTSTYTTAISGQPIPGDTTRATEVVEDADTADADVMNPAQTPTSAGNDSQVANPVIDTASTGEAATDENITYTGDPAGTGSGIHAPLADKRKDKTPVQDQGRRLYQEAMLARKAHMMKMLEYRAKVKKRIEQDRRDLYWYRHNSAHQRREHQDRYRNRPEQARNGA